MFSCAQNKTRIQIKSNKQSQSQSTTPYSRPLATKQTTKVKPSSTLQQTNHAFKPGQPITRRFERGWQTTRLSPKSHAGCKGVLLQTCSGQWAVRACLGAIVQLRRAQETNEFLRRETGRVSAAMGEGRGCVAGSLQAKCLRVRGSVPANQRAETGHSEAGVWA